MTNRKEQYEKGCLGYVYQFESKHSIEFNGWVNNEVGEIASFGEMFVNFRDLKYDIDEELPEHIFAEWYYDLKHYQDLDEGVAKSLKQHWIELQVQSIKKLPKKDVDKYISLANAIQKYLITALKEDFAKEAKFITPTLAWLSKELHFINLAIERNMKPSEFLEQYDSDNSYFYKLHNGKDKSTEKARKKSEQYILELIKTILI